MASLSALLIVLVFVCWALLQKIRQPPLGATRLRGQIASYPLSVTSYLLLSAIISQQVEPSAQYWWGPVSDISPPTSERSSRRGRPKPGLKILSKSMQKKIETLVSFLLLLASMLAQFGLKFDLKIKKKEHLRVQVRFRHRFCMHFRGSETSILMLSLTRRALFAILRMS